MGCSGQQVVKVIFGQGEVFIVWLGYFSCPDSTIPTHQPGDTVPSKVIAGVSNRFFRHELIVVANLLAANSESRIGGAQNLE